ncbi:MAG: GerMN domain-containing protein [Acidimicrobiales bacterium]|nr:GerMN domain-containing protein [Acidimicrobiales bacterium]
MSALGRRRGALGAVVVVAVAATVAACGVSAEPDANRIDPSSVPFGLLEAQTTTTEASSGTPVTIYLLSGDALLDVRRSLPDDGSLADLLELVVTGPTPTEQGLGVTSAVAPGTVASVQTERGIAEVDLTESFGEIGSGDQLLALAQIVYVLTGQPGIGAVSFTLEGEPIEVPRTDGTASDQPLTRDDFAALAPD